MIIDLQRRYRQLGRIRIGERGEKGQPAKRNTFRLTSPSQHLLDRASQLWGGTPHPWTSAPNDGEWELATTTDTLQVLVPPQDLDHAQWYEQWAGGGIKRRCDSVTELVSGKACMCDPDNRTCQITTHLIVVLPQLPDVGVWRLTTHGFNAAVELPGTVGLIDQIRQAGGMPAAELVIEKRSAKVEGRTNRFVVPVLRLPMSLESLGFGSAPALPAASFGPVAPAVLPAPPPLPEQAAPFALDDEPDEEVPDDWAELLLLLDDEPVESWTMPRIEAAVRRLYELMGIVGVWVTGASGIDPLHMALGKYGGVQHLGELRKADLLVFAGLSWENARVRVLGRPENR